MTDEYVVIVTTDENLLNSIQNATKMDVIHTTNHNTVKEKNYRRKIVILDPDTVSTRQEHLSTWHDNAHHLIVLLNSHHDDFIEQNQELISDVWYKPVNSILIVKRLHAIQRQFLADLTMSSLMGMRAPLTTIRGYSEILLSISPPVEKMHEFVTVIKDNASYLNCLIHSIRNWINIISGEFELELKPVNLAGILEALADEAKSKRDTYNGFYTFNLTMPDNFSLIWADSEKLQYVLDVILLNTKRWNSNATQVKVWQDEVAHIAVSSEKEFIDDIPGGFNFLATPFADRIIAYIISEHNGQIWFETNAKTGSTFHFTIPIAKGGYNT